MIKLNHSIYIYAILLFAAVLTSCQSKSVELCKLSGIELQKRFAEIALYNDFIAPNAVKGSQIVSLKDLEYQSATFMSSFKDDELNLLTYRTISSGKKFYVSIDAFCITETSQ